jgi:hypothetical protein
MGGIGMGSAAAGGCRGPEWIAGQPLGPEPWSKAPLYSAEQDDFSKPKILSIRLVLVEIAGGIGMGSAAAGGCRGPEWAIFCRAGRFQQTKNLVNPISFGGDSWGY